MPHVTISQNLSEIRIKKNAMRALMCHDSGFSALGVNQVAGWDLMQGSVD